MPSINKIKFCMTVRTETEQGLVFVNGYCVTVTQKGKGKVVLVQGRKSNGGSGGKASLIVTYLLTYSHHGTKSLLRSYPVCS